VFFKVIIAAIHKIHLGDRGGDFWLLLGDFSSKIALTSTIFSSKTLKISSNFFAFSAKAEF